MTAPALRLLGPLELTVAGRAVDLGGARQRTVLALMALNLGRVVSVERLIDAVWEDAPPQTARSQIQICVCGLRKLLGGVGVIRTRRPGYLLQMPAENVDSERFSWMVDEACAHSGADRPSEAAASLRRALALWRGPVLADVHSPLVQRVATRIEVRRFAAAVARVQAELACGRHREMLGELRMLVDEHPLDEELYRLLMLAQYRAGLHAEALGSAREARASLVAEVGLEPGEQLRSLQQAILNRDPALELPATAFKPAAPGLPAGIDDFVGRAAELAAVRRALPADLRTAPHAAPVAAVYGRPGIGKTTLIIRLAHEVAYRFPDGVLYADLGDHDRPEDVLDRFLATSGVDVAQLPPGRPERAAAYQRRLAERRVLVVLDDVKSWTQLAPLLPDSPACAALVTSRDRLPWPAGAHEVDLDVLDRSTSVELLERVIGQRRAAADPAAMRQLANLCGGLPLALRVAGTRLAAHPRWPVRTLVQRLAAEAGRLEALTGRARDRPPHIDERARQLFLLAAFVEASDSRVRPPT